MNYPMNELIHGLSYETYAAEPGLRSSHLGYLMRSPAHLQAAIKLPKPPTDAMNLGKVVHSLLENGEKFMDTFVIEPVFEGRTKDGKVTTSANATEVKEKRAAWYSDLKPGTTVINQEQYSRVQGIAERISTHGLLNRLIKNGIRETSLWAKCPETGLTLQCRPDFIAEKGFIVDFKTARDASQGAFYQEIFRTYKRFYILGAAHYAYCAKLAGLPRPDGFTFVAIENEAPYGINIFPMDEGCLDVGERWRSVLTKKYAECLEKDSWPCYEEKAIAVEPPQYPDLPNEWEDL
jgi:hypothetical protein